MDLKELKSIVKFLDKAEKLGIEVDMTKLLAQLNPVGSNAPDTMPSAAEGQADGIAGMLRTVEGIQPLDSPVPNLQIDTADGERRRIEELLSILSKLFALGRGKWDGDGLDVTRGDVSAAIAAMAAIDRATGRKTRKGGLHGFRARLSEHFGNSSFTQMDVRSSLGMSRSHCQRRICAMEKKGMLRRVGAGNNGSKLYRLNMTEKTREKTIYKELEAQLMQM